MTEIWIDVMPGPSGWDVVRRVNTDHWPDGVSKSSVVANYRWKYQARLIAIFLANYEMGHLAKGESIELSVHKRNGQIGEKNTYGYDSEESEG